MLSCSVVSDSLQSHGLKFTRFLCPWDSPGTNTGVGCPALLQGIFPTQGSNPCLLHLPHLSREERGRVFTTSATWEGSPPAMATESLPTLAAPPYSYCPRPPILCAWPGWHRAPSPLEQEEVDVVVALGEEVAEDPSWVAAADLVGGQPEVHALDEVPQLRDQVLAELPGRENRKVQGGMLFWYRRTPVRVRERPTLPSGF